MAVSETSFFTRDHPGRYIGAPTLQQSPPLPTHLAVTHGLAEPKKPGAGEVQEPWQDKRHGHTLPTTQGIAPAARLCTRTCRRH